MAARLSIVVVALSFVGVAFVVLPTIQLPSQVFAESDAWPCAWHYGQANLCGPEAQDAVQNPGACKVFVGTASCTEQGDHVCTGVSYYWCLDDDECANRETRESHCATSNYPTVTPRWYYDCPAESGPAGDCTCVIYTDNEDVVPVTAKRFTTSTQPCG